MFSISRRQLLGAGASLALISSTGLRAADDELRVFIGCYTNASGENVPTDFGTFRGPDDLAEGVYTFIFNPRTGMARDYQLAARSTSPVNLIMHPNQKILYACRGQETRIAGQNVITAFSLENGTLRELNTVRSGGSGPTVGMVSQNGRFLLTTNFASNSIVAFRLNDDGSLSERTAMIGQEPPEGVIIQGQAPGSSPLSKGTDTGITKPHAVVLSASERFAIASEINANQCRVMRFDETSGNLETHQLAPDVAGAGPRHLCWHPSYRYLYTSGEANSSISTWQWDEQLGELKVIQNLSCLPPGYKGDNHPADVCMHPGGRFVYVTNRGAGTIAGYAIDPSTGRVALIGQTVIGSPACWGMLFDPSGQWALIAEQIGDEISIWRFNETSGELMPTGRRVKTVLPSCLRWASV